MLRIDADLVELMAAAARGNLGTLPLPHSPLAAATVMMVSGGYPGSYPKGKVITGIDNVKDSIVFHAGTKTTPEGQTVTSGGRVLAVSSTAPTLEEALAKSFGSIASIDFEGAYFRRDIGRDVTAK